MQNEVERVLAVPGMYVLQKVLNVIESSVQELHWPLTRVEVRYTRDPEVIGWEYVLLVLVFTSSFETADRNLHELYDHLDSLADRLDSEEQAIMQKLLFFDIETTAHVPTS